MGHDSCLRFNSGGSFHSRRLLSEICLRCQSSRTARYLFSSPISRMALPSGSASSLAVELPPGQYQFSCYIIETEPDGSEEDHYKEGMVTPFTVT